jgi:hypothetical protein
MTILEASFIEQKPRGPAYAVPAPQPEREREGPPTPEEVVQRVMTDAVVREAADSKGKLSVKVVQFDFDEAKRQAIVKGGCEVELLLRVQPKRGKPFQMLLGVALPGASDDGSEMHWHMLEKSTWNMLAYERVVTARNRSAGRRGPVFEMLPLYLWPGTGLKDAQENCSVLSTTFQMPGLLGQLTQRTGEQERRQNRKFNKERLEFHRHLDRERREAAARRLERTGDAGITDEELAALVPSIDLDHDRITMRISYNILRLWDDPADSLIEQLPPECVGLALFGHRPASVAAEDVLRRCAWALRRGLRGAEPARVERATAALAAVAAAHLDPADVKRTLSLMKL